MMAKNGFKVMDSDMHVIEPADLWQRYMDAEFKDRVVGMTRYERDLMDEHQEWKGYEHPELTMKPSDYFKRQCFASVECDEWPSKYVDDAGFGHTVVFSTDNPHRDSKYPHAVDAFLELDLEGQTKRKYLWDNCARLYGFSES